MNHRTQNILMTLTAVVGICVIVYLGIKMMLPSEPPSPPAAQMSN